MVASADMTLRYFFRFFFRLFFFEYDFESLMIKLLLLFYCYVALILFNIFIPGGRVCRHDTWIFFQIFFFDFFFEFLFESLIIKLLLLFHCSVV